MTDIVTAIYDLMGEYAQPNKEGDTVKHRVESIFKVRTVFLDINAVADLKGSHSDFDRQHYFYLKHKLTS